MGEKGDPQQDDEVKKPCFSWGNPAGRQKTPQIKKSSKNPLGKLS